MSDKTERQAGERLLSAVERLLDDNDNIISRVETFKGRIRHSNDPVEIRKKVTSLLVSEYSNKAALSGGASALPAMFPGVGTIVALTGGNLVDMALVLKFEVELSLSLCWLYGMDIRQPKQRQIAYLLASVHTHDVSAKRPYFADIIDAEATAIWSYAPRQATKLLLTVFGRLALMQAGKGLLRGLPFVGVIVGGSVNKALTTRVGNAIRTALDQRDLAADQAPEEELVDAKIEEEPVEAEVVPVVEEAPAKKPAAKKAPAKKPAAKKPAAKKAPAKKAPAKKPAAKKPAAKKTAAKKAPAKKPAAKKPAAKKGADGSES